MNYGLPEQEMPFNRFEQNRPSAPPQIGYHNRISNPVQKSPPMQTNLNMYLPKNMP